VHVEKAETHFLRSFKLVYRLFNFDSKRFILFLVVEGFLISEVFPIIILHELNPVILSDKVDAEVVGDAVQPGKERTVRVVHMNILKGFDENVASQISGIFFISEHPSASNKYLFFILLEYPAPILGIAA
jgi:hypothetical protein